LEYVKLTLLIAISVLILSIIIWNFRNLNDAVGIFLARAPEARISIKYLGAEASLDQAGIDRALIDVGALHLTVAERSQILKLIKNLTAKEVERLMQVGQLSDLCEFENPKPAMRMDVAIDYGLEKKGLTTIYPSPDTLAWVKGLQVEDVAHGKGLDIGHPRTCYELTLTPAGYDVKSVLTRNLSEAFDRGPSATP
jgi:hypothetical protein